MASSTKIDEIIDPKAFSDWERFVKSLETGQENMSKMVKEVMDLNKAIQGSASLKDMQANVKSLQEAYDKLDKERTKLVATQDKLAKAEEQLVKLTAEKARVLKEESRATKEVSDNSASYNKNISASVIKSAELKKEINTLNAEYKKSKDTMPINEVAVYEQKLALLKEELRQSNVEVKRFAKENLAVESSVDGMAITLAKLRAEYSALSKEQRENADVGGVMLTEIQKLDAEFRELRESQGTYTDSVGNYAKIWDKIPGPIKNVLDTLHDLGVAQQKQDAQSKKSIGFQTQAQQADKKRESATDSLTNAVTNSVGAQSKANESTRKSVGFTLISTKANEENTDAVKENATALDNLSDASGNISFSSIIAGLKALTLQALAFIATPIGAAIALLTTIAIGTKAFFDFNMEIAKSNKLVEDLANTSGDATDKLRQQATAISEAFGKEFSDVVKELSKLQKDFGVSSQESFDIYVDGLIRGGQANQDFGDSIREYGVLFANSGYSAQEFINILNTGIDLGVYSDKLPDAIKEAGISLNEQTTATRDALVNAFGASFTDDLLKRVNSGQTTIKTALEEISSEAEKAGLNQQQLAQITADVFRGAGEDAGGALVIFNAINQSIDLQGKELTDLQKALKANVKQMDDLEEAKTRAFKSDDAVIFGQRVRNLGRDLQIWFYDAISNDRNTINTFIDDIQKMLLSIQVAFPFIPKIAKAAMDDFINILKTTAKSALGYGKALGQVLILDIDGAKKTVSSIKEINTTFDNSKKVLKDLSDAQKKANADFLAQKAAELKAIKLQSELEKKSQKQIEAGGGGAKGTNKKQIADTAKSTKEQASPEKKLLEDRVKANEDANKRLLELSNLRLSREKDNYDLLASYSMKVANDGNADYIDRLSNLNDYLELKQKAIESERQSDLLGVTELYKEAEALRLEALAETDGKIRDAKLSEAQAIKDIALLTEQEINDAVAAKRLELNKKVANDSFEITKQEYKDKEEWTLIALEQTYEKENKLLVEQKANGLITEEEFLQKGLDLLKKFNDESLQLQIDQLKKLIEASKAAGQDTGALEKQLAKLQIQQAKAVTDAKIEGIDKVLEKEQEAKDKIKEYAKETAKLIIDIANQAMDAKIAETEAKIADNEVEKQIALERVENSTLNEEQKAAQKFAIESKFAAKEKQLEEQRIKMQQKQAKINKAIALTEIAISTAKGMARALFDYAFPINLGVAAAVGAFGLAQGVLVARQKVPQFYKGTDSSPEGWAHVGERGTELRINPDKTMELTPPTDTLTYLERGTKIYNARETKSILSGQKGIDSMKVVNFDRMINEQKRSTSELKKSFRDNASQTMITKEGLRVVHARNSRLKSYLSKNNL